MSVNRFIQRNPLLVAASLAIIVFVIGATNIDGFSRLFSLRAMLVLAAFLGIASVGQTLAVLLAGIDLSIPFVIGFGNVVAAKLTGDGMPFWRVVIIVLSLALLIGAFNGFTASRLKIHPLILTLGVGFVIEGSILLWTKGFPTGSAPKSVTQFVSIGSRLGPFPFPGLVLFWMVVAVVVVLLLRETVFGRQLYGLGSNPVAARLALVRPVKIWTIAFALSAFFAALAGILLLGFTGSAMAAVGDPYMFQTIGAVVIGGTAMVGGRGSYAGTVIGSFALIELTTVLRGFGLPDSLVPAALGLLIIILVSIYGREPRIRDLV
jgi:ribose transport system permease protein